MSIILMESRAQEYIPRKCCSIWRSRRLQQIPLQRRSVVVIVAVEVHGELLCICAQEASR